MEDESNNKTTWLKNKQKKRHIANSDTDSENSYPVSQPTNSSLSTSTKKTYIPRFLIIHSEKEGETVSSLSPFVVHKTIMSIAGEPKSIKNLRSCDLFIQCAKESHEKSLLQMKTMWFKMLRNTPFILEHIQGYHSLSSLEQSDKR